MCPAKIQQVLFLNSFNQIVSDLDPPRHHRWSLLNSLVIEKILGLYGSTSDNAVNNKKHFSSAFANKKANNKDIFVFSKLSQRKS